MEVYLDETQAFEPDGKNRWKQDDVAKEMLTQCANDVSSKAAKEVMSLLTRDAEKREQRLADRLASDFDPEGEAYGASGRCRKRDFRVP